MGFAGGQTHPVELQLHELAEATGVVVAQSLGIPESLQDGGRVLDLGKAGKFASSKKKNQCRFKFFKQACGGRILHA